jgi:hypothetical protein
MSFSLSVLSQNDAAPFQASKWLKFQILCSSEELALLFARFPSCYLFRLSGVVNGKPIDPSFFVQEYGRWIDGLKHQIVPTEPELKQLLAAALINDPSSLWLQKIPSQPTFFSSNDSFTGDERYITKIAKPIIQIQTHYFTYSTNDQTFHSMSMGPNSIFWGVQFAYPQLYQDPITQEILSAPKNPLFEIIRQWAKETTRPTPFLINGVRINAPFRIGKESLEWAHLHPQLLAQSLRIWK